MSRSITESLPSAQHHSRRLCLTLLIATTGLALSAALVVPAQADPPEDPVAAADRSVVLPRLVARATMPADNVAPGPRSGVSVTEANGRTGPFDGQVIPGFSAAVANGDGTFWAMPDNGFGTQANSATSCYGSTCPPSLGTRRRRHWRRYRSCATSPWRPVRTDPLPDRRRGPRRRRLTGGDFDIESLQRMPDGTFWIGEEFGPFLLHVDAAGTLSATRPVPTRQVAAEPDLGRR